MAFKEEIYPLTLECEIYLTKSIPVKIKIHSTNDAEDLNISDSCFNCLMKEIKKEVTLQVNDIPCRLNVEFRYDDVAYMAQVIFV